MSAINVVPYIDVMLVLLIIFMVTAPLLTEGVKVDLPQGKAKAITDVDETPFVVFVNRSGQFFLTEDSDNEPSSLRTIGIKAAAVLRHRPKTLFLVRGDRKVNYGSVMQAMVTLQDAGVDSVGLVTEPIPLQ